jgi:hypothetical protein
MWILVWFMFTNGALEHYELGQFRTREACQTALNDAKVLVTISTIAVYCFEVTTE